MKKLFFNFKPYYLSVSLFLTITINSVLLFLISPLKNRGSVLFYIFIVLATVMLFLTCFEIILIKKKNNTNLLPCVITMILVSSVLDTFVFKIISMIDKKSIFTTTGFLSVILIFCYFLVVILLSYFLKFTDKKEFEGIDL